MTSIGLLTSNSGRAAFTTTHASWQPEGNEGGGISAVAVCSVVQVVLLKTEALNTVGLSETPIRAVTARAEGLTW